MARMLQTPEALAQKVLAHAEKHYHNRVFAWDMVVECCELSEIVEVLRREGIRLQNEAISCYREVARLYGEQRRSVQAEAF